jgi:hypothetical protein
MVECSELCKYNLSGICSHDNPEIQFDTYDSGRCLSYEVDWEREWTG